MCWPSNSLWSLWCLLYTMHLAALPHRTGEISTLQGKFRNLLRVQERKSVVFENPLRPVTSTNDSLRLPISLATPKTPFLNILSLTKVSREMWVLVAQGHSVPHGHMTNQASSTTCK